MTLITFLIILGVLVLVHELGHFVLAKKAGVKVEEFGFGYPPRAISIGRKWGTLFSINWIPFGGFVKILGENYEKDESQQETDSKKVWPRATEEIRGLSEKQFPAGSKKFTEISKKWQAAILAAGVSFNIIFAWILFSASFIIGVPAPVENDFGGIVKNPTLTIVELMPDAPAQKAGLKTGDKIKEIVDNSGHEIKNLDAEKVSDFINTSYGEISIQVDRGGKALEFHMIPENGLIEGKKIIGISMDMVGTLSLPLHRAVVEGAKATINISYLTVEGLFNLVKEAVKGKADVSQISGPVGIVGLVGDASRLGFAYLLTFTALISINLAIINLVPFPALDGGRILFVIIESLTKRPINPRFAQITNTVGFALLITLMLFVTYRDILKLL
jgi:regulator of sigma E protease